MNRLNGPRRKRAVVGVALIFLALVIIGHRSLAIAINPQFPYAVRAAAYIGVAFGYVLPGYAAVFLLRGGFFYGRWSMSPEELLATAIRHHKSRVSALGKVQPWIIRALVLIGLTTAILVLYR